MTAPNRVPPPVLPPLPPDCELACTPPDIPWCEGDLPPTDTYRWVGVDGFYLPEEVAE